MRLSPSEVGPHIIQSCIALTPCDEGDEAFRWICKDWGGVGTTCGYFVSAVMWLAGVRGRIVNRSDEGCKYVVGANVSAIFNAGRFPFTHHTPGKTYPPGSILFVSEGPPTTEHLMVLGSCEGMKWTIYQGGGVGPKGEAMRMKDLRFDGAKQIGGRTLVGVIQPDHMPVMADAVDVAHVLSASWFERPVRDPYTGELAQGLTLRLTWWHAPAMKKTALVDCDGVLSNFVGGVLNLVAEHTGVLLHVDDVQDWHFLDRLSSFLAGAGARSPEKAAALVKKGILQEGFVENLEPLPGAQEAVERLSAVYDVVILTSPFYTSPYWMYERTVWCQRHLGIHPTSVIQTGRKHMVHGDLFIDDKPSAVGAWAQKWGHDNPGVSPALLWTTPQNMAEPEGGLLLRRVHGWDEVFDIAQV